MKSDPIGTAAAHASADEPPRRADDGPTDADARRARFRRRAAAVVLLSGAAAWAVVAWGVMPALIRAADAGTHVPGLSSLLDGRDRWPAEHYLGKWNRLAVAGLTVWLVPGLVILGTTSRAFARRSVGTATPGTLGAIRAFVCLILVAYALTAGAHAVVGVPRPARGEMALMNGLFATPASGLPWLVADAARLHAFAWLTAGVLLLGAVGLATRWVLPLGAALYLVLAGIPRTYYSFDHSGIVPLYVLLVLCFTPSGDGWSIDRWLRRRKGLPVAPADERRASYAWGRYLVWCVIALPYVCAGLCKVFNDSVWWWEPLNLRRLVYAEALRPNDGNVELLPTLVALPDWVYAAMGLGTVAVELGMGLTLVSRRARLVLPVCAALMHVGIDRLEQIRFYDLILIQAVFYDWTPVGRWLVARGRGARIGDTPAVAGTAVPPDAARPARAGPLAVTGLACLFLGGWAVRVELYPLTSWQMFSDHNDSGVLHYYRVWRTDERGRVARADLGAMGLGQERYRQTLKRAFLGAAAGRRKCVDLLTFCGETWNRNAPPGARVTRLEVVRHEWDFVRARHDPRFGRPIDSFAVAFDPGRTAFARRDGGDGG